MYYTVGAIAQHSTTCCTLGFRCLFYNIPSFIISPTFRTHKQLSDRFQRGPKISFPRKVRLNICINTHVSRAVSYRGWAVTAASVFPTSSGSPTLGSVSIAPCTVVAKPKRPLPARCNVQRSQPALHDAAQRLWSPRRLLSHSVQPCYDSDELRANLRMRRAPDGHA